MHNEQTKASAPRKGIPDRQRDEAVFNHRHCDHFFDSAFRSHGAAMADFANTAWQTYCDSRRSPQAEPIPVYRSGHRIAMARLRSGGMDGNRSRRAHLHAPKGTTGCMTSPDKDVTSSIRLGRGR